MKLRFAFVSLATLTTVGGAPTNAGAHPHVWVTVESTALVGADRSVLGIRHKWTFDELYSSFAVQGLDKKGGNNPSREELKELAQLNIESLKEFGYFTQPQAIQASGTVEKVGLKPPVDYFLEHKDGLLSLTFTLPFEKAVPAEKSTVAFAVVDPSFFIAFQFAKTNALSLAQGAPAGCRIELRGQANAPGAQAVDKAADKLEDAFAKALGAGSGGASMADSVLVACAEQK